MITQTNTHTFPHTHTISIFFLFFQIVSLSFPLFSFTVSAVAQARDINFESSTIFPNYSLSYLKLHLPSLCVLVGPLLSGIVDEATPVDRNTNLNSNKIYCWSSFLSLLLYHFVCCFVGISFFFFQFSQTVLHDIVYRASRVSSIFLYSLCVCVCEHYFERWKNGTVLKMLLNFFLHRFNGQIKFFLNFWTQVCVTLSLPIRIGRKC